MGLALSYAAPLVSLLGSFLTSFTETEKEMVSVERVLQVMILVSFHYISVTNTWTMFPLCMNSTWMCHKKKSLVASLSAVSGQFKDWLSFIMWQWGTSQLCLLHSTTFLLQSKEACRYVKCLLWRQTWVLLCNVRTRLLSGGSYRKNWCWKIFHIECTSQA